MVSDGEKDARRKRRAEGDLRPLLRKRRNEFFDYAYAGDPKLMIERFPEMELTEDSDYFKKIPPSTFDDKNIIEQYGKKLRELRTERGCSLQRVADYIGVDFQAISQVEKGVRKKISRNPLLLLCAFFRCSPEVVLGLKPNTTRVELFFDRQSRDRAFYVVDHLVSLDYPRETDVALLMQFFRLSEGARRVQQKAVRVFKNAPSFRILSHTDATREATEAFSETASIPTDNMVRINKAYGYAVLEDLDKIFPDLLDVFISITASDCKTRHIALLLLQVAGFCDNEDACSNETPRC